MFAEKIKMIKIKEDLLLMKKKTNVLLYKVGKIVLYAYIWRVWKSSFSDLEENTEEFFIFVIDV